MWSGESKVEDREDWNDRVWSFWDEATQVECGGWKTPRGMGIACLQTEHLDEVECLNLPDTAEGRDVTAMFLDRVLELPQATKIHLPSHLKFLWLRYLAIPHLEEIEISADNSHFAVYDHTMLTDKEGDTLLYLFHRDIGDTLRIPAHFQALSSYALHHAPYRSIDFLNPNIRVEPETFTSSVWLSQQWPMAIVGYTLYKLTEDMETCTIPACVKWIEPGAFSQHKPECFAVSPDNPWMQAIDGVLYTRDGKTLVCYPPAREEPLFCVPEGVEAIGDMAFAECHHVLGVWIPDSVTRIGTAAFASSGCRFVRLPRGLETLPGPEAYWEQCDRDASQDPVGVRGNQFDGVFDGCFYLEQVIWPEQLRHIGYRAFVNAPIENVELPEGLERIDSFGLRCSQLLQIQLPGSLRSMGEGAIAHVMDCTLVRRDVHGLIQALQDTDTDTIERRCIIHLPSSSDLPRLYIPKGAPVQVLSEYWDTGASVLDMGRHLFQAVEDDDERLWMALQYDRDIGDAPVEDNCWWSYISAHIGDACDMLLRLGREEQLVRYIRQGLLGVELTKQIIQEAMEQGMSTICAYALAYLHEVHADQELSI